MEKWLRRVRGVIGMGLTWAVGWFGAAGILSAVGLFGDLGLLRVYVVVAALWGVVGFVGGSIFSVVLGIAERSRTFDEMSLPRFSGWGAVGGFLLAIPWLFGAGPPPGLQEIVGTGVLMALMGAGSAGGSLALARRAGPLLESGEPVGLLDGETLDASA